MQQGKAAKVDAAGGGGAPSTSTQKTALLEQLGGLVASAMNGSSSTSPNNGGPSEGHSSEEKTDNQTEGKKEEREAGDGADPFLPAERPLQKNKKKCWICKCKLELAQRELGTCKCGKLKWSFLLRLQAMSASSATFQKRSTHFSDFDGGMFIKYHFTPITT